jgi:hypothetical protein
VNPGQRQRCYERPDVRVFEGIVPRLVKAAQQAVANSDRLRRKTSGIEKNRRLPWDGS